MDGGLLQGGKGGGWNQEEIFCIINSHFLYYFYQFSSLYVIYCENEYKKNNLKGMKVLCTKIAHFPI